MLNVIFIGLGAVGVVMQTGLAGVVGLGILAGILVIGARLRK